MAEAIETACPSCQVMVRVGVGAVYMDDETQVYRFVCPECGFRAAKNLNGATREVLYTEGVRTVEQIVESEAVELVSDQDIWRAVLS